MVEVIERHIELSYNICIRGTFVRYAVASFMIRSNTAKDFFFRKAESESAAGVITTYYVLLLITLFFRIT